MRCKAHLIACFVVACGGTQEESQVKDITAAPDKNSVAVDPGGAFVEAWTEADEEGEGEVVARFCSRDGLCGAKQSLEASDNGDSYGPVVVALRQGQFAAFWYQTQSGEPSTVRVNHGAATTGWLQSAKLSPEISGDAFDPQAAAAVDGTMVVAWRVNEGTGIRVWGTVFFAGVWSKPHALGPPGGDDLLVKASNAGKGMVQWKTDSFETFSTKIQNP